MPQHARLMKNATAVNCKHKRPMQVKKLVLGKAVGKLTKNVGNPPTHPPALRGKLHFGCNAFVVIKCSLTRLSHYSTNPFHRQPVQLRLTFLELWLVTVSFTPTSLNFVTRFSNNTAAFAETLVAFRKNSLPTSFLDGGSAILLFEGTRANQVNAWAPASIFAKKPDSVSTVPLSEKPLSKENLVPSLSHCQRRSNNACLQRIPSKGRRPGLPLVFQLQR